MDGNVLVGECDSEIPQVDEEVGHDCYKCVIELCVIFGGGHEIDWNGFHGGAFSHIENDLVLPTLFDN